MEFEHFNAIRYLVCIQNLYVTKGQMMSAPAIHYKNKVFAFLSSNNKMVFKLGKTYPLENHAIEMNTFSPFKNKKPLSGWYEVDYKYRHKWITLTLEALELMHSNQKK